MKDVCPCKKCNERYIGCHANCELYLEWNERHLSKKKAYDDAVGFEKDYNRYKKEVCARSKKYGR